MRLVRSLCFALIAAAPLAAPARGEPADDRLKVYAVHIYRTGHDQVFGNGVYLGHGVVLTAAHVAGLGIWREPQVGIAGKKLATQILKDGHFYSADLELLSIDERALPVSLALRRMPLCQEPSWAGQPVIVATPDGVARSKVLSPVALERLTTPEFRTAIAYVAESGESGSGVFDGNKKCLLGIITRTITQDQVTMKNGQPINLPIAIAKYFIPASMIAAFIPK